MGFFGGSYDNPADSAMPYLQEVPGTITPYYQDFIDNGTQAGNILVNEYGEMATNPQQYYNDTMAGYTQTPMYQYNQQQLMGQQAGAAAAGGYAGTNYDANQQAYTTQGLLAQDQQRYYQNVTGAQQYGLGGEQDLYHTGYQASSSLANDLASNLAEEAGLQYKGTAFNDQMKAQQANNRWSALGTLGGIGAGIAFGPEAGVAVKKGV